MPDPATRRRTARLASAALGLLAVALVGGGLWAWTHPAAPASAGAGVPSDGPASPAAVALVTAPPATRAPYRPGAPRHLSIPALHVEARVLPVRAPGGTLVPPSDPLELGWWAGGAEPGARRGTALIAGHTVHTGGGALDHLGTLHRGDVIRVRTDHDSLRYVVRSVHDYPKGMVARQARRLFSQHVPGRLVVVTCGDYDGVRYLSNYVVTATPRQAPAAGSAG